jgi:acetylornithine deacetylase/succinyl-diaminopimelate desuccinylase-like protein
MTSESVAGVEAYVEEHFAELVAALSEWVRIPSVAGDPSFGPDLRRSARLLRALLQDTGFPVAEVWETEGGPPAVYAEWCAAPGAPTVLVYSHHDVRIAKDTEWGEVAPFDPTVREGRLWGRGSSDAKGQVLAHVWGIRGHLAATGRAAPAVNLRVLVEGEEEEGSPSLKSLLEQHPEARTADVVVLSDSLLWREDTPAVCMGLRGAVTASLEVRGPERDVHSGAVSGPAPNPILEMCRLLAQLHDDQWRVQLPGFYDDVAPPDEADRAAIAALPYDDEDWLRRSETGSIGGEAGYTPLERLWLRPAAEVLGIAAGELHGPTHGAIPSIATASISIRTVLGQDSERVAEQLRQWVKERISDRVDYDLTVALDVAQEPYVTPADTPAVQALTRAMSEAFHAPVGRMRNAGGSPAALLHEQTGAPVVFFGTGLPEDHWHDSDESVSLDMLRKGAVTLALLWSHLAE